MSRNNLKAKEIYQQFTGNSIPKGWEVHHQDIDFNNNEFYNLLAIPKEIHRKYHLLLQDFLSLTNPFNHTKNPVITLEITSPDFQTWGQSIPLETLFGHPLYIFLKKEIKPYTALKNFLYCISKNPNKKANQIPSYIFCKDLLKQFYPIFYQSEE